MELFGTYPSWSLLIVRVVLGVIFFGHGAEDRQPRWDLEGLLKVADRALEAVAAEPAEHLLRAVAEEDDTQDNPHNQEGPGWVGAEEFHGAIASSYVVGLC